MLRYFRTYVPDVNDDLSQLEIVFVLCEMDEYVSKSTQKLFEMWKWKIKLKYLGSSMLIITAMIKR